MYYQHPKRRHQTAAYKAALRRGHLDAAYKAALRRSMIRPKTWEPYQNVL